MYDHATWLLLLNPISGCGLGLRDRQRIETAIAAHGLRHVSALSEYPGHVVALVAEAIGRGCRRILIAGGDGSMSEAVNGIFSQQAVAPEQVTLALLPNLRRLFDGSLASHPKVSTWRSAAAAIEATAGTAVEADGELVGHAPAIFSVMPRALRVIAPAYAQPANDAGKGEK